MTTASTPSTSDLRRRRRNMPRPTSSWPAIATSVLLAGMYGCEKSSNEKAFTADAAPPSTAVVAEREIVTDPADLPEESNPFLIWDIACGIDPAVEEQVLERSGGTVTVHYRLRNPLIVPITIVRQDAVFVQGTYYRHPSSDAYEVEGEDRHIAIWLVPKYYWAKEGPDKVTLSPEEDRRFSAAVAIPADAPNPLRVEVSLVGPIEELHGRLGDASLLRWIELPADKEPERP